MSTAKIGHHDSTVTGTMHLPARVPEQGRHRVTSTTLPQHLASYMVKARKQAHR